MGIPAVTLAGGSVGITSCAAAAAVTLKVLVVTERPLPVTWIV